MTNNKLRDKLRLLAAITLLLVLGVGTYHGFTKYRAWKRNSDSETTISINNNSQLKKKILDTLEKILEEKDNPDTELIALGGKIVESEYLSIADLEKLLTLTESNKLELNNLIQEVQLQIINSKSYFKNKLTKLLTKLNDPQLTTSLGLKDLSKIQQSLANNDDVLLQIKDLENLLNSVKIFSDKKDLEDIFYSLQKLSQQEPLISFRDKLLGQIIAVLERLKVRSDKETSKKINFYINEIIIKRDFIWFDLNDFSRFADDDPDMHELMNIVEIVVSEKTLLNWERAGWISTSDYHAINEALIDKNKPQKLGNFLEISKWIKLDRNFTEELISQWKINGFTPADFIDLQDNLPNLTVSDSDYLYWLKEKKNLKINQITPVNFEELRAEFTLA